MLETKKRGFKVGVGLGAGLGVGVGVGVGARLELEAGLGLISSVWFICNPNDGFGLSI